MCCIQKYSIYALVRVENAKNGLTVIMTSHLILNVDIKDKYFKENSHWQLLCFFLANQTTL